MPIHEMDYNLRQFRVIIQIHLYELKALFFFIITHLQVGKMSLLYTLILPSLGVMSSAQASSFCLYLTVDIININGITPINASGELLSNPAPLSSP